MVNFRLLIILLLFSPYLKASEIFYFGDSHSTGTALASRLKSFLKNPTGHGCSSAPSGQNLVRKFNGNGLDPRHWVTASSNSRNFLYRVLEQTDELNRAGVNETALGKLIDQYGENPDRKLVLEFGDNSVAGNLPESFAGNLEKMIDQLGVKPENCIVVAPQPHIKPQFEAGKKKILAALREVKEQNKCNVVFFDESGGRIPLTDGIHSTPSGYNKWADQVEAGICSSNILNETTDSVSGCDNCEVEGMPVQERTQTIFGIF